MQLDMILIIKIVSIEKLIGRSKRLSWSKRWWKIIFAITDLFQVNLDLFCISILTQYLRDDISILFKKISKFNYGKKKISIKIFYNIEIAFSTLKNVERKR